jgi:adenylate cyclase
MVLSLNSGFRCPWPRTDKQESQMTPRILVVDDEPDLELLVTQNFRRQIRKGELSFVFARDGQDALQVLEEDPDVQMILSDINMPRMDGLTLLEHLHDGPLDMAAVIVSAYGDMTNIRTAMNRGAFDFLTKPIEFDDLEATIRKTLEHMQMMRTMQEEKAHAERDRDALSRFFSPNVISALAEDPEFLDHGGERRMATYMFTDLANFTSLVESTSPTRVFDLLNDYLENLTRIVFAHEGTVTKIVGDAVHAIFGAPLQQPDHAAQAVACALEIDAFSAGFVAQKVADGIDLGQTRVGINSGLALIGNFGGEAFFDYTAHGDAVNTAARLETVNKHLGTTVCVAQSTVDLINGFSGRPVGELLLKGKNEQLMAWEPLTAERFEHPSTAAYMDAWEQLKAGDPSAYQAFAALVGAWGEDPLADFHLHRVLGGSKGVEITFSEK